MEDNNLKDIETSIGVAYCKAHEIIENSPLEYLKEKGQEIIKYLDFATMILEQEKKIKAENWRKCAYCEKKSASSNTLEVQNVFGRYEVRSFVTENRKPVLLCPDCLERVIYKAAKDLWEESGMKEVENG